METQNLLSQALSNALANAQAQVKIFNDNLIADYRLKFDNWTQSFLNGRTGLDTLPKPPKAYVLGSAPDPTTGPGSNGPYGDATINWATAVEGTQPVCDPLPIPTLPNLHPSVGSLMQALVNEGGVTVTPSPFNNSVALYTQPITAPDGSVFVRVK